MKQCLDHIYENIYLHMYIEIVPGTKCWVAYFLSVSQSMLSLRSQSKNGIILNLIKYQKIKNNFFSRQEQADVPNVAYTKVNQCPQIGQKMLPFFIILKYRRWILGQAPASCLPSLLLLRLSPKICKSHDYYSNIIKCY